MKDCIFCKIIKGELPSYKIYEDDLVLAFLDINPLNLGHALVIPKEHSQNALEMDKKFNEKILEAIKKVSLALKKIDPSICDDLNIYSSVGAEAGQVIFHTHFHVIPRHKNDGLGFKRLGDVNFPKEDFTKILGLIKIKGDL